MVNGPVVIQGAGLSQPYKYLLLLKPYQIQGRNGAVSSIRITKSRAGSEFGIKSKILDELEYEEVPNPNYKSAPPMRLYGLSEIEALAKNPKNLKKTFLDKELAACRA